MEPMSLLAELYGEGRVTAERMRTRGLTNLEDVCRQGPQALARMLKISERAASKMLAEARLMDQASLFEIPKQLAPAQQDLPQARSALSDFKTEVLDMVAKRFR